MGFRSLAQSWLVATAVTAAFALPALAQQSQPAPHAPGIQPAPPAASDNATPSPNPAEQPPGTVRSSHGAWSVICDKPAGAMAEQCALMQNVIAEDQPEIGLSVVVLKTADRKAKILRVLAPLGVLLDTRPPSNGGLGLIVDGQNLGNTQFARCFSDGCYAEVDIDDNLMKMLRSGSTAVFSIRETGDKDSIGIPVELKGFAEGYDALP